LIIGAQTVRVTAIVPRIVGLGVKVIIIYVVNRATIAAIVIPRVPAIMITIAIPVAITILVTITIPASVA